LSSCLVFLLARAAAQIAALSLHDALPICLLHPDAELANDLLRITVAEIRRLEAIFSLYRPDSALSRLNRDGRLAGPPLDFVELLDRKSTRLNSSHVKISYAVFCLKKKTTR